MNENLEVLIEENANLIYKIANMYRYSGIDMEDLKQVGKIGFIHAYQHYNASFDSKFTTYAYLHIKGEISKYVRENRGMKVSRNLTKLYWQIDKATLLLAQQYMREPSPAEIAIELGLDEDIVVDAMLSRHAIHSIDEPVGVGDSELSLHEVTPAPIEDIDTQLLLQDALTNLTDEEYQLVLNRYMRDLTQSEVASLLGTSQVQVSRKEQKVMQKLRTYMTC